MRKNHFGIHEFIYPSLFERYAKSGTQNRLWRCLDPDMVESCNRIRDFVGSPVTVNTANTGGRFSLSGLRPFNTTVGAKLSQHKFGRAADCKFSGKYSPVGLRRYMRSIGCFEDGFLQRTDAEAFPFLLIRRIEWIPNMSWFHLDTFGGHNAKRIIVVGK